MKGIDAREAVFYTTAIFVFLLIISGNYLGELLPCRVQNIIQHNMMFRHFFGYLTLLFFVIISTPELFKENIFVTSIFLYMYFIVLSKTHYIFWLAIVIIFGIIFLMSTYYKLQIEKKEHKKIKDTMILRAMRYGLVGLIAFLTIAGLLVYMGNKKREYGSRFNYLQFFLGNPECSNTPVNIESFVKEASNAFK